MRNVMEGAVESEKESGGVLFLCVNNNNNNWLCGNR